MASERVIVVGAGGISTAWFPVIKAEGVTVAAVVDLRADAVNEKIEKYELVDAVASTDLDATLAKTKADFVLDLTIPESHCDVTCKSLRAGFDVLGEKPMATNMEQARKMVQASEETGRLYMVSQSRRWESNHECIAQTIRDQKLGTLTTINCDFYIGAHFGGFRDEMDSPLILDMAIHHFDMARMFSGLNAVSAYAEEFNPSGSWYKGAPAANCLFEMENGVRFAYRGSWCAEGCHTTWAGDWRIIGQNATLLYQNDRITGEVVAGSEGFTRPKAPLAVSPSVLEHTGFRGSLREMLAFLRTGQKPQTECHDNIHSLAMVHAAIASSRTSKRMLLSSL